MASSIRTQQGVFASLLDSTFPDMLREASISVDTMNGLVARRTMGVKGLIVKCSSDHELNYGSHSLSLPTTYGVDRLPFSKEDMPSPAALKKWDYLKHVVSQLPSYNSNIPFGLVIGGNCSKALEPYEVVNSVGEGPFAYRTLLGWCIVGFSREPADQLSKCLYTHVRVLVDNIATNKPTSHYFKHPSNVVDTTISDVLQAMYFT